MPLERNDVEHPLWRKKVDRSLLRYSVTPIPGWVGRTWSIRIPRATFYSMARPLPGQRPGGAR